MSASRWPTCWPPLNNLTTTTTCCGWPSATRPPTAISTSSAAGSAARCGTASGPPRARSSSPGGRLPARVSRSRVPRRGDLQPETLQECATARFDASGALANLDEARSGEIVNTTGGGMFGGYYNDPNATDERYCGIGIIGRGPGLHAMRTDWICLVYTTADWMRRRREHGGGPIERIIPCGCPRSARQVYPGARRACG